LIPPLRVQKAAAPTRFYGRVGHKFKVQHGLMHAVAINRAGHSKRPSARKKIKMKLALLSDIHANIQAFDACLAHAREEGATQFALLGDLVGYGADPVAVVQRAQNLADAGAMLIKGNHDAIAVAPPAVPMTLGDTTSAWTHAQLDGSKRRFLHELPMTLQHDSMLLVHASADVPEMWRYVYDERAARESLNAATIEPKVHHVFGGHVHFQTLYSNGSAKALTRQEPVAGEVLTLQTDRHWLATIGSVGQPRDGNTRAMYAVFDTQSHEITFHRVAYDHQSAADAIRKAGLPNWLASRIEQGR
jgi:diadenosine tetraphosphatase ApaH/serine/threonine PP2A family protein phosphatase